MGNEAHILRGFKGNEVPLYLKGRRVGKDIERGGVDTNYAIIFTGG